MRLLFIAAALLLSQASHAADSNLAKTTGDSILAALQCQGDVLATFRNLGKQKTDLKKAGVLFSTKGKEMDEKISLKFKDSLELFGFKTKAAEMYIDGGEFIAYADFAGDPDAVVKKLELTQSDPDNKQDYVNLKGPNTCQPVQRVRKLGPGKFRFGCGWCNG